METAVMDMVMTEVAVTEIMRMAETMRNNENGGNGEGTISDDDMNWSGRVCWI
jgi:hypothetical protein